MSPQHPTMDHYVEALDRELTRAGAAHEDRLRRRARGLRAGAAVGLVGVVLGVVGVGVGDRDRGGTVALGPVDLGPAQAAAAERCRRPSSADGGVRSCLSALGAVAADWQAPGTGPVAYERTWSIGGVQLRRSDGTPAGATADPDGFSVAYPVTADVWIAPSGAGQRTDNPQGRPFLPTARDRRRWRSAGSPALGGAPRPGGVGAGGEGITTLSDGRIVERWGPGASLGHALVVGEQGEDGGPSLFEGRDPTTTLSRDPCRLVEQLGRLAWRQRVVLSGDPCPDGYGRCPAATERGIRANVGTLATGLLAYPATPRDLRAALLRSLADLPGASTRGRARDALGRRGVLVRLPEGVNDGLDLLLFDTRSARLLAQGTAGDGRAGTRSWQTLHAVSTARVDRVGQLPAPR